MKFFNAETQRRRVAEGQRVLGSRGFRVRGCTKNLTPMVGKRGSATASPLLRAFQPINMWRLSSFELEEVSSRPPLPKAAPKLSYEENLEHGCIA